MRRVNEHLLHIFVFMVIGENTKWQHVHCLTSISLFYFFGGLISSATFANKTLKVSSTVDCDFHPVLLVFSISNSIFVVSLFPWIILRLSALFKHFFFLQDDTTFEKQSALFALAVSDIVLINM